MTGPALQVFTEPMTTPWTDRTDPMRTICEAVGQDEQRRMACYSLNTLYLHVDQKAVEVQLSVVKLL